MVDDHTLASLQVCGGDVKVFQQCVQWLPPAAPLGINAFQLALDDDDGGCQVVWRDGHAVAIQGLVSLEQVLAETNCLCHNGLCMACWLGNSPQDGLNLEDALVHDLLCCRGCLHCRSYRSCKGM